MRARALFSTSASAAIVAATLAATLAAALTASPATAASPAPAVAQGLPPEADDLADAVVLSEPLVHIRDLLDLPVVSRLLAGLSVGELPGNLDGIRSTLAETAPLWPREVGLGLPASGVADVDRLVRVLMLASLCQGAKEAGPDARVERPKLQKALAAELRGARLPGFVLWARFANGFAAANVARLIRGWLQTTLEDWPVPLIAEGDGVGVRVDVGSLFKPAQLRSLLVDLGWLASPSEPQAKALTTATASLHLEAWVELRGASVLVRLGPRAGVEPPPIAPPAGATPAQQIVAVGRWQVAPVRAVLRGWAALWAAWEHTAAARKARESDDTDILGDVEQITRTLERSADQGQAWLWADRGLHGLVEERGGPPFAALASDPILSLLPATAIAVDVDGRENLGERLSSTLSRIEDRLAMRSLRDLGGEDDQPGPDESREAAYYKQTTKLRALIHTQGPSLFEGASALVVGRGERLPRVDVREEGKPLRTLKDLPLPEVALVGRAKDPQAALRFAGEVWAAVATAAVATPAPSGPPALLEAPAPAPGGQARWFDPGWVEALTRTTVTTDDGFKPQIAIADKLVVLSTSPRLAQRILATRSAPDRERFAAPAAPAPLVAWSRYPCAPVVQVLEDTMNSVQKLFGPQDVTTKARAMLGGLCDVVEGLSSTTAVDGDRVTTHFDAPASPALYRPAANARKK